MLSTERATRSTCVAPDNWTFATGRISNISGGARDKYTVTVPDKDPNAKTLTLYVDVTNPHALEYTFRDIPIT